eukprot:TRINITY_DN7675_c1_g2_i1.p2 TRINITY_DN7675_c1_g2~~TRINITY_DN7675_c1_g2_i1.p2  ORF type:complete len:281 (+),score=60.25 TRINITY_DN7675_c1_g2_i1:70-912(+)
MCSWGDSKGRAMTHQIPPAWRTSRGSLRVLLVGGAGLLGRGLARALVSEGHQVHGTGLTTAHAVELMETGAKFRQLDVLLEEDVDAALQAVDPDVVVHMVGGQPHQWTPWQYKFKQSYVALNSVRSIGTEHLLQSCKRSKVKRVVATSLSYCTQGRKPLPNNRAQYEEAVAELQQIPIPQTRNSLRSLKYGWMPLELFSNDKLSREEIPDVDSPSPVLRSANRAIAKHERLVNSYDNEHCVLRLGHLYGPGTALDLESEFARLVRGRRVPLLGYGLRGRR